MSTSSNSQISSYSHSPFNEVTVKFLHRSYCRYQYKFSISPKLPHRVANSDEVFKYQILNCTAKKQFTFRDIKYSYNEFTFNTNSKASHFFLTCSAIPETDFSHYSHVVSECFPLMSQENFNRSFLIFDEVKKTNFNLESLSFVTTV